MLDVLVKVFSLGRNDLCAQEAAQQAFVMMRSIYRNVTRVMQARLALVAVD